MFQITDGHSTWPEAVPCNPDRPPLLMVTLHPATGHVEAVREDGTVEHYESLRAMGEQRPQGGLDEAHETYAVARALHPRTRGGPKSWVACFNVARHWRAQGYTADRVAAWAHEDVNVIRPETAAYLEREGWPAHRVRSVGHIPGVIKHGETNEALAVMVESAPVGVWVDVRETMPPHIAVAALEFTEELTLPIAVQAFATSHVTSKTGMDPEVAWDSIIQAPSAPGHEPPPGWPPGPEVRAKGLEVVRRLLDAEASFGRRRENDMLTMSRKLATTSAIRMVAALIAEMERNPNDICRECGVSHRAQLLDAIMEALADGILK